MNIKVGNIVSHTGAIAWGAGKVLEISASSVMIQFSDGKSRKIAASHFTTLKPAALDSFLPPPETAVEPKKARAPRVAKKKI